MHLYLNIRLSIYLSIFLVVVQFNGVLTNFMNMSENGPEETVIVSKI